VRGGPWVAARIHYETTRDPETGDPLDRPWYWWAEINGEVAGDVSPVPSDNVWTIALYGTPISAADYDHMLAVRDWARAHAPDEPEANPHKRVNLNDMAALFRPATNG
jgi:hypothetical protein